MILEPLNSLHAYLWNVKVREREEELTNSVSPGISCHGQERVHM